MKPAAHDAMPSVQEIENESDERALFAARARFDRQEAPPFAAVLAAIDEERVARPVRALPRALAAASAIAACVGALLVTAHALTHAHDEERIVSDRGDASAPSAPGETPHVETLYTSATSAAGATTCDMDRSIASPPEVSSEPDSCPMEATCSIDRP